jgi:hypothetical protein
MTLLNPLHDITDDLPYFSLRKMRFVLHVTLPDKALEVGITQLHKNAVFVELYVHLAPPV